MTKFKAVMMEKHEYEFQHETLLVAILEFSNSFDSGSKITTNDFWTKSFPRRVRFLIETMM